MADFLGKELPVSEYKNTTARRNNRRPNPTKGQPRTQRKPIGRVDIPGTNRQVDLPRVAGAMGATGVGLVVASSLLGGGRTEANANLSPLSPDVLVEPQFADQNFQSAVAKGAHPQKFQETPGLIIERKVSDEQVKKAFSQVPDGLKEKAEKSIPLILAALRREGIDYESVFAFALATAEHEANFNPAMREYDGKEQATRLNYEGGEDFYGRGLVMLTHKKNYAKYGKHLNIDLVNNPDLALNPEISARILAAFLKLEGVADLIRQERYEEARKRIVGDYDEDDEYNRQITRYIINRTNSYLRSIR